MVMISDSKISIGLNLLSFYIGMTVMNVADDQEEITTTLAVLEGAVAVHESWTGGVGDDDGAVRLVSGEAMDVTGRHIVTTVSATPSCYVFAATVDRKGDGGCDGSGGSGDGKVSTQHASVVHNRSSCSDACYAFALHTIRDAFSAFFSRTAV